MYITPLQRMALLTFGAHQNYNILYSGSGRAESICDKRIKLHINSVEGMPKNHRYFVKLNFERKFPKLQISKMADIEKLLIN